MPYPNTTRKIVSSAEIINYLSTKIRESSKLPAPYPPILTTKKKKGNIPECLLNIWMKGTTATQPIEREAESFTGVTLPKIPITTSKPSNVRCLIVRTKIQSEH